MDWLFYFRSRQGEMIQTLKNLVKLESPTIDKNAVDRCSEGVIKEMAGLGVKIKRMPQKETGDFYLIEYIPAATTEGKPILLLGHTDTVWPVGTLDKMPFYIEGEKIYGPGVLDMKAGLVSAIYAIKAIISLGLNPRRKIWFFLNSAEETGNDESHKKISELARKSGLVLCLEPGLPGGTLKVERKGRLVVKIDCSGTSAHASTPEKGVNAIEELIFHLNNLKKIKIKGLTCNIGLIGGGEKANVVPEKAWAVCDFRFWRKDDLVHLKSFLRELKPAKKEARVKTTILSFTPPMEFGPASRALFEKAKALAREVGLEIFPGKSGGGSDASIASSLGLPALDGLGPEGEGMHARHEHLILPTFIQKTALLTKLLLEL